MTVAAVTGVERESEYFPNKVEPRPGGVFVFTGTEASFSIFSCMKTGAEQNRYLFAAN
jgi:hypothetical protein